MRFVPWIYADLYFLLFLTDSHTTGGNYLSANLVVDLSMNEGLDEMKVWMSMLIVGSRIQLAVIV